MSLMSFARLINSDGTHYLYLDYCTYFHTVYVYNSNITYDSFMVILAQNLQLILKKRNQSYDNLHYKIILCIFAA